MTTWAKALVGSLLAAAVFGGLLGCDIDHHRHYRHYGWYDSPSYAPGWGRSGYGYYHGYGPYAYDRAWPYYGESRRWSHRRYDRPWG
jgi:hypothetical protein